MKNSFLLYNDSLEVLDDLNDTQIANLFRAIKAFTSGKETPVLSPIEKVAFLPIRQYLKRDGDRYETYLKKQSDNGKKGGRPKKPEVISKTQKTQALFGKPKKADSVSVSVNDSVNKYNTKDIPIGIGETTDKSNPDINYLVQYLRDKLELPNLDGSVVKNRRYCFNLLRRFKKEYPNRDAKELITKIIDYGVKDKFHSTRMSNFAYLFNNYNKILLEAKSKVNNPKITIIK